jgi:hypothetical protein
VRFRTLVEAAARRREVAIGYRIVGDGNGFASGVRMNPPKSEEVVLGEADRLVVLAED